MCSANEQSLQVSYLKLSYTAPLLAIWLADAPREMLSIFDKVAWECVLDQFPMYNAIHHEVFVRITELPIEDKLRDLRQLHLNALIKVAGVVTKRTAVFPQVSSQAPLLFLLPFSVLLSLSAFLCLSLPLSLPLSISLSLSLSLLI